MITPVLHSKGVSVTRPPLVSKVNFRMVDLREVFTSSDLLHSISISKVLFIKTLIRLTCYKIMA